MTFPTPTTLLNNIRSPSVVDGVPQSSHFGVYQQTAVGTGDVSIRTLVPAAISAAPYRNALIAKLFFRQIFALTHFPSTSFNDLMTTVALYVSLNTGAVLFNVASYFSINTGSAEKEADSAAFSIYRSLVPLHFRIAPYFRYNSYPRFTALLKLFHHINYVCACHNLTLDQYVYINNSRDF